VSNKQSFSLNRIRWACRRGMLELDIILLPFFEARFKQLSENEQTSFVCLLEYPDPDLYAWLLQSQTPDDTELSKIVEIIRQHVKNTA